MIRSFSPVNMRYTKEGMSYFVSENCFLFFSGETAACCLLHADPSFGSFFVHDDGGDVFVRIVCHLTMDYKELYVRRQNSSYRRCENLKSYIYPNTLRQFSAVAF
jgi:hypothetical protein